MNKQETAWLEHKRLTFVKFILSNIHSSARTTLYYKPIYATQNLAREASIFIQNLTRSITYQIVERTIQQWNFIFSHITHLRA